MKKTCLFLAALTLCRFPAPAFAKSALRKEAEDNLINGGYAETLAGAAWAAGKGEAIVPILKAMLDDGKRHEDQGAFPFNAVWALAMIKSEKALRVLESYYAKTKDETAKLAISGRELRRRMKSDDYGVLVNGKAVHEKPREDSRVMTTVSAGQAIRILKRGIESDTDEGPRGDAAVYDYVEILPDGIKGYIERAGDDFVPWI